MSNKTAWVDQWRLRGLVEPVQSVTAASSPEHSVLVHEYTHLVDPGKLNAGANHDQGTINEIAGDMVVFDWRGIHRILKPPSGSSWSRREHTLARRCPSPGTVVTSVCLHRPWELIPLSAASSSLNRFVVDGSAGYQFKRNPEGQWTSISTTTDLLQKISRQFADQGVDAVPHLSEFVCTSPTFDQAIKTTGSVHKALKQSGFFTIGDGATLVPRTVTFIEYKGKKFWNTVDVGKMESNEEQLAYFTIHAYLLRARDEYSWGGEMYSGFDPSKWTQFTRATAAVVAEGDTKRESELAEFLAPLKVEGAWHHNILREQSTFQWSTMELRLFAEMISGPIEYNV